VVDPSAFYSKSRNTPFTGEVLRGRPVLTIVGGKVIHEERAGGE
jgi:dihydroorotase